VCIQGCVCGCVQACSWVYARFVCAVIEAYLAAPLSARGDESLLWANRVGTDQISRGDTGGDRSIFPLSHYKT